jgi:hypothetical protein
VVAGRAGEGGRRMTTHELELMKLGAEFLKQLGVTWICPDVAFVSERPEGQAVSLESWRKQLADVRTKSVGQPGIYLDRSPTGAGKSFADMAAIERSGCGLIVTPTHEQCGEIVAGLKADGIKAVAFPKRTTQGDSPNCWNEEADAAEAAGFPVVATVCGGCKFRDQCLGKEVGPSGYQAEIVRAEVADIVVATHKRIEASGLNLKSQKWPFVSIHEDATDVLFPSSAVSLNSIVIAQQVVRYLLESPRWLNWLGATETRDDDGNVVPDAAKAARREALDAFIRHLDDSMSSLIKSISEATQTGELSGFPVMEKPNGVVWLLWQAQKQSGLTFIGESPWRAILTLFSDDRCHGGCIVPSEKQNEKIPVEKTLIVVRRNLPHPEATVWLADATADKQLLELGTGQTVIDWTPDGHLELTKPVTQIEQDVTRRTTAERLKAILRGVLFARPDAKRVGVITHSKLKDAAASLGEPFSGRIVRVAYFGSGEDRASNSWYQQCDLIIVAGTPRVPPQAVQKRLFQLGEFTAGALDGDWSKRNWKGFQADGTPRIVSGRGYQNETWNLAYRSLVRAAIIQAAGRGRGLLSDGCEVLILSNEECSFPLAEKSSVEPLPEAAMIVLEALTVVAANKEVLGTTTVNTLEVAEYLEKSREQAGDWLKWLHEHGLIDRHGERGGWLVLLPASPP